MGKKIIGWIMFGLGVPYIGMNVFSLLADMSRGIAIDWGRESISFAFYFAITALLMFFGWRLAHSTKKVGNDVHA